MRKLLFFILVLIASPSYAQVPSFIYSTAAPLAIPSGSGWSGPGCSGNSCYRIPLDNTVTTAGSTLVLFFSYDSTSNNQVFSVTDDKSNTWTLDIASAQSNNKTMRVYRATNIAAGTSSITIQLTSGAQNNFWQPIVMEFFNANALDGSSCNAATSATVSAGSITPTVSGDLIVQAKYSTTQVPQTASFTVGSQANITWNLAAELLGDGAADQYGVYASTSAINPTFTQATSDAYISCAVALKAATVGSSPTVLPRIFLQEHDAMPKNAPNPWKAGFVLNTPGSVYLNYVGNDAIHNTGGTIDGVTSSPAPTVAWSTGADFVGSNGHNHTNSFCARFDTAPGTVVVSINRVATTNDSINMIYVVPGGTCTLDVDNGGATGDQTTGTSINVGSLTPTRTNDIIFGFGGQFWCTSTSMSAPTGAQFDSVFFSGITIDGPAQTDENNFWFHLVNGNLSTISPTVQDTCTGSAGPGSPTFWANRIVAYKSTVASTCSRPDVSTAVGLARVGDTVSIPACSQTNWTSTLTINVGITLQGQGQGVTIIGDNVSKGGSGCSGEGPAFAWSVNDTSGNTGLPPFMRMTGLTIVGVTTDPNACQPGHISVGGSTHSMRIDHVTINPVQTVGVFINGDIWGVIDHLTHVGGFHNGVRVEHLNWNGTSNDNWGDRSWATAINYGSGEGIYIEDSSFTSTDPNFIDGVTDCFSGGRLVFRHNTVSMLNNQSHGADSDQRHRACRWQEIYNNTYTYSNINNLAFISWIRGGTGVFYNNTVTASGYSNKMVEVTNCRDAGAGCGGGPNYTPWGACNGAGTFDQNSNGNGYRCVDQPGAGTSCLLGTDSGGTVTVPACSLNNNVSGGWIGNQLDPVYVWNNTLNGSSNNTTIGSTNETANQDFFAGTTRPSYASFTYPHPLAINTSQTGTPAVGLSPTSLSFVSQLVGTTSAIKTVTLTNTGTAALNFSSVAVTGANQSDFAPLSTTCFGSLAVNANCSINISSAPLSPGAKTANITVVSNSPTSPDNVPVTGFGLVAVITGQGKVSGNLIIKVGP